MGNAGFISSTVLKPMPVHAYYLKELIYVLSCAPMKSMSGRNPVRCSPLAFMVCVDGNSTVHSNSNKQM